MQISYARVSAEDLHLEPQIDGINTKTAARKSGRVGGRKRQMTDREIASARKLLEGGAASKDVAHDLGVSVPTLYRWLPASTRS